MKFVEGEGREMGYDKGEAMKLESSKNKN